MDLRDKFVEKITECFPDGWAIKMYRNTPAPRDFHLTVNGVRVAIGAEFKSGGEDWIISYYDASETKGIIDGVIDTFRRYRQDKHERETAEWEADCARQATERAEAARRAIAEYAPCPPAKS